MNKETESDDSLLESPGKPAPQAKKGMKFNKIAIKLLSYPSYSKIHSIYSHKQSITARFR